MVVRAEPPRQARRLTTTSYAVLAILSLREHSTYDLTRQMRLSLHYLWPRAESNVYAEPARLVAAGLATARVDWVGRRRRRMYGITDAGRAALAEWAASPSAPARFESEGLLKVFFAELGSAGDLQHAIDELARGAADVVAHFVALADRYAAGVGQYPGRFGLTALAARLLVEQQAATLRWAAWATSLAGDSGSTAALDAGWGVETLRSAGAPFPLDADPVAGVVSRARAQGMASHPKQRPGEATAGG